MPLVTASAKNHSRIRRSDSASAITTAWAERLGRLATNERGMLFVQLHSTSGSISTGFLDTPSGAPGVA
jgi:hypothetical protein